MDQNGDEWQQDKGRYQAFLLRCWQENELSNGREPAESVVWRFALVQINDSSQTKCFASLEELVAFLRGRLSQATGNEASLPRESFDNMEKGKR